MMDLGLEYKLFMFDALGVGVNMRSRKVEPGVLMCLGVQLVQFWVDKVVNLRSKELSPV